MTRISRVLDSIRPSRDLDDLSEAECPACRGHLSIHQPDEGRPDHLLGTCDACGTWSLIDAAAGLMVVLPDVAAPVEAEAPAG